MDDYKLRFASSYRSGLVARSQYDDKVFRAKATVAGNVTRDGVPVSGAAFHQEILLRGPGDVISLDPGTIARVYPASGKEKIVSSHFPFIEFHEPDVPWRYSALGPDRNGRIRPWLVLLVLEVGSFELRTQSIRIPTAPGKPDAIHNVTVLVAYNGKDNSQALPNLAGPEALWAWAHCQSSDGGDFTTTSEKACSRLLCPILLERGKRYTAFLVPSYEIGRLAGLGIRFETRTMVNTGTASDPRIHVEHALREGLTDATACWSAPRGTPLELPVYHQWSFDVDTVPEFEELVRRLRVQWPGDSASGPKGDLGAALPSVDGSRPGYFPRWNPRQSFGHFPLEAALMPLGMEYKKAEDAGVAGDYSDPFARLTRAALTGKLIGIAPESTSRGLTFGEYLRSRAEEAGPPDSSGARRPRPWAYRLEKQWFWKSLRFLAWLGLALWKSILFLTKRSWIRYTADPLLSVPCYGEAYFRRRDQAISTTGTWPRQLNLDRRYRVAAAAGGKIVRARQDELIETCLIQLARKSAEQPVVRKARLHEARASDRAARTAQVGGLVSQALQRRHLDALPPERLMLVTQPIHHLVRDGSRSYRATLTRTTLPTGTFSVAARKILYKKTRFRVTDRALGEALAAPRPATAAPEALAAKRELYRASPLRADQVKARALDKEAFQKLVQQLLEKALKKLAEIVVGLAKLAIEDLKQWIEKDMKHRFEILEPPSKSPTNRTPVYQLLLQHSSELLLPQLQNLGNNRVLFLQENRRFIEALMVGLNHELVREMIWREIPTDVHATVFRYFWDTMEPVPLLLDGTRLDDVCARISRTVNEPEAKFFRDAYEKEGGFSSRYKLKSGLQDAEKARLSSALVAIDYHAYVKEIREWARPEGSDDKWTLSSLGENAPAWGGTPSTSDRFVVAIRGDLIRQIPQPMIFLVRNDGGRPIREILNGIFEEGAPGVYRPEVKAVVGNDVLIAGFPADSSVSATAIENAKDKWLLVMSELPSLPRFGLDAAELDAAGMPVPSVSPVTLSNVSWGHVSVDPTSRWVSSFRDFEVVDLPPAERRISWSTLRGAMVANLTLQQPSMVVFSFARMNGEA